MQLGEARSPNAMSVLGSATTKPDPDSPMNEMNRPMPMAMARRRSAGMASMMAVRRPHSTKSRMAMPSTNTTAMATRQSTPAPWQMEKATTAFNPMPDASAMGRFAIRPIATVATAAPRQVEVSAAEKGMPAAAIMFELTATT